MHYKLCTFLFGTCLLLVGCIAPQSKRSDRPLAAAVVTLETLSFRSSVPRHRPDDSTPEPDKERECENCHGRGKLGDGQVVLPCPACHGTGKVTTGSPANCDKPTSPTTSQPANSKPLRVQCLVFTCQACPPCHAMRREVEQQLKPLGWEVGESPHCHIRFVQQEADRERWTERFKVTSWPTLVLLVDGQEKGRFVGRMAASELSRRMIVLQKETLGKK